jgi:hypothetical protein
MYRLSDSNDPALRVPGPPKTRHVIGLDLGQSQDYTAVSVLAGTFTDDGAKPTYQVGHLERFPLGTPYPDIGQVPMCGVSPSSAWSRPSGRG